MPAAARLEWKWIIAGNVFSSLLLMAIPPLTLALKKADPYLPSRVEPSEGALSWAAALGSLAAFGLGFLIPLRWKRKADLPDADSGLDKGSRA